MYSVVFTRGDSLPSKKDFLLIAEGLTSLCQAKSARKASGDLVIYSTTLEIVCDDLSWLDVEHDTYALRMVGKQNSELARLQAAKALGINVVRQALTYEQKLELYHAGKYSMPAPSVCSANWNTEAWINHIENYGNWHVT